MSPWRLAPAPLLRLVLDFLLGVFLSLALFAAAALILATSPLHAVIWGRRFRARLVHRFDQARVRWTP